MGTAIPPIRGRKKDIIRIELGYHTSLFVLVRSLDIGIQRRSLNKKHTPKSPLPFAQTHHRGDLLRRIVRMLSPLECGSRVERGEQGCVSPVESFGLDRQTREHIALAFTENRLS
jgi:hypothetical protein